MKMNRTSVAAAVVSAGLVASLGALAPATVSADELTVATPAATSQSADAEDPAATVVDDADAAAADAAPSDDAVVSAVSAVALSDESAAAPEAKAPVTKPVAKIDETGYATLDEAVAAAKDGDTIELLQDAVTENGFGLSSMDLTIKGNNHIITANKLGIYLYKGAKPAKLTFNDVTLNMAPADGTPTVANDHKSWAVAVLNYDCHAIFNNSNITMAPAGSVNTGAYFHVGAKLTLNNSKMSVKGFSSNGFAADTSVTEHYSTEVNVMNDSNLEIANNRAGITNNFQVTVDGSKLTDSKNRAYGSNGSDFIIRNKSVVDVSSNGSHGMSARNVTISAFSKVTCNDNGYYGVTFFGNLDIDGTSSLTADYNAGVSGGGLRAATAAATGHVAPSAVVEICNNKHNGLENKGTFTFEEGSKLTITGNHDTGNGGGVFNYASGVLTLPSDAVIYNNHADKSGDDICSKGVIFFGGTGAGWTLNDCNHTIDGWYVDGKDSRWSAHEEPKFTALAQPGKYEGEVAFKAAHGLVKVDYQYVGDKPANAVLPDDDEGLEVGSSYTAQTQDPVDGWTFAGWYTDEACTTKWVDGDELSGSMTLYGKWNKNPETPATPAETQKPTTNKPAKKQVKKSVPKTGDETSSALPFALFGGAAAVIGLGVKSRRHE